MVLQDCHCFCVRDGVAGGYFSGVHVVAVFTQWLDPGHCRLRVDWEHYGCITEGQFYSGRSRE